MQEKLDSFLGKFTGQGEERKSEEKQVDFDQVAKQHATSEVGQLRRELEFRDAVDSLDVKLTSKQRRRIRAMWDADRPDDHDAWLSDTLEDLQIGEKPAAAKAEVGHRSVPSTPAPLGSDKIIPEDPRALSADAVASMSPGELRAHFETFQRKNGVNNNVWAQKLSRKKS
jgi:hypothetical protein